MKHRSKHSLILIALIVEMLAAAAAGPTPVQAATLRTPNWIASHMVLQRGMPVPIWGTGTAGATVTVSFNGQTVSAIVGRYGNWRVKLASMVATAVPGTMTITMSGGQILNYTDVQVGEVWLCSGQSNMEKSVNYSDGGAAAVVAASNYNIRFFAESNYTLPTDSGITWQVSDPATTGNFSAVCYYFGRELTQDLNVPIGLIDAGMGGSYIEYWSHYSGSGFLYDSKIKPLQPYAIRGVAWYQGESNSGDTAARYYDKLQGLIQEWRNGWGQADLYFGIVQLPMGQKQAIRNAQLRAFLTVPKTFLAITTDLPALGGTALHPANKRPIGLRLAIAARALIYNEQFEPVGPIVDPTASYAVGNTAIIGFKHVGSGLVTGSEWQTADAPFPVYLAGSNLYFYPGTATIVGNTLHVTSASVRAPLYVRYTWQYAMGNLYSMVSIPIEGGGTVYTRLPAAPFTITLAPAP